MKKDTLYSVIISSVCFLLFVYLGSELIPRPDLEPVGKEIEEKVVYLTFDDGPSQNTEAVLDILKDQNVRATFFVTGQNPDYFPLMERMHKEDHVIAAHTYSHSFSQIYANSEAYFQDLDKMNDVIERYTKEKTKLIRFPGGSSNTVSRRYQSGIMSELAKVTKEKGYVYFDWNASNGDGSCGSNADSLLQQTIRESKGKNEVMILMHDGSCNAGTVNALPSIISYFKQEGYVFRVVEETTDGFHHTIAN